jgi:hypothetical protein
VLTLIRVLDPNPYINQCRRSFYPFIKREFTASIGDS